MKKRILAYLVSALFIAAGCNETLRSSDNAPIDTQGIRLASSIPASADVAGIRFEFQEVSCEDGTPIGEPIVVDRELEPYTIPGGIAELEDAPLDASSAHLFADAFKALPAGCYSVTSTPIQADGSLSEMCLAANKDIVEVIEGQTTEIVLINQCAGKDPGALDAISVINHEPEIDDVFFEESKFTTCEEEIVVCATVTDPDNDPLEFVWELTPGAPPAEGPVVVSHTTDPATGAVTECVAYVPNAAGQFDITVTVYDLLHQAGELIRIEDWLAQEGYPSESHTTLDFFFYSADSEACCLCPEGFERTPAGDGCVQISYEEAVVNGTTYLIEEGDTNPNYTGIGAYYPGGTISKSDAPDDFWSAGFVNDPSNRLNAVGIWSGSSPSPTGEWIGFSRCLQIDQPGEYMVGIAGDNRVRLTLNGEVIFVLDDSELNNFRRWYIRKIELSSGPNVLVLEGKNDGSDAAFGAEISGPFPAGSLVDDQAMMDADFDGNIIFSTADQIGEYFETGEHSGIACPEGYVMDSCAEGAQCVRILHEECNAGL